MAGEPRTEAGRRLLASDFDTTGWTPSMVRDHVTRAVLAIEDEARHGLRDEIRATKAEVAAARREGLDAALVAMSPFLRHRSTCYLQAVRDNAPGDELCDCGLARLVAEGPKP